MGLKTAEEMGLKTAEESGFKKTEKRVGSVLKDPKRVSKLIETTKEKIKRLELGEHEFKGILGSIKTFIRMLRAFRSGQYDAIPWVTIVMVVAALIYFVTPLDLFPDFIPVAGYVDDFSLIMTIFNRFKKDIVAFQAWEKAQG